MIGYSTRQDAIVSNAQVTKIQRPAQRVSAQPKKLSRT